MRTWTMVGWIVLAGLVPVPPASAATGDFVTLSMRNVSETMILMSRDGEFANLIVTATGNDEAGWFTASNGNAADLPPAPFPFRVMNLYIPTSGGILPTPVTDSLRHCAQVSELVQLQPEKFRMFVRVDGGANSSFTLDTASDWLNLRLWAPGGSFRCGLRNL